MWQTLPALVANAVLVFGPAALLSAGHLFGQRGFWMALGGLSLALAAELIAQSPHRALTARSSEADRSAKRLNIVQGVLLLAVLQFLAVVAAQDAPQPHHGMELLGLVVLATAAALRLAAIRQLGPGFTDGFQPATAITRSGPYQFVRHPAELGLLLLPVGFATVLGVWPWLAIVWPPLLLVSYLRIWNEELGLRQSSVAPPCIYREG